MSESSISIGETSIKIGGSSLPRREENFPTLFGEVARVVWKRKTAHELAIVGKASDRAAKDWLKGKVAPPATVIAAIVNAITRRD